MNNRAAWTASWECPLSLGAPPQPASPSPEAAGRPGVVSLEPAADLRRGLHVVPDDRPSHQPRLQWYSASPFPPEASVVLSIAFECRGFRETKTFSRISQEESGCEVPMARDTGAPPCAPSRASCLAATCTKSPRGRAWEQSASDVRSHSTAETEFLLRAR